MNIVRRWNMVLAAGHSMLVGPISYFQEQLALIRWTPLPNAEVLDQHGSRWSVRDNSFSDFRYQLHESWVCLTVPKVRKDEHFQGLEVFHVDCCRASMGDGKQYNTCRANYSVGAIMNTAVKSKFLQESQAKCHLCGQDGGACHILFHCSGTQSVRDSVQLDDLQRSPNNAVRVAGLFPAPSQQSNHFRFLNEIPDVQFEPILDESVHFFTDGSTKYGTNQCLALSSWAIVRASPESLQSVKAASRCLPGALQTNNKAELYAVWQVLRHAVSGVIYTDSKYCFHGCRLLQRRGWIESDWRRFSHYGLWRKVWEAFGNHAERWQFVKVASHQRHDQAHSFFELRCSTHNDAADGEAKKANLLRTSDFWNNHSHLQRVFRDGGEAQKKLALLQDRVSAISKRTAADAGQQVWDIAEDLWAIHRNKLRMLQNERFQSMPSGELEFDGDGFLMRQPFATLLWDFLRHQQWSSDSDGFSLYELHFYLHAALVGLLLLILRKFQVSRGRWRCNPVLPRHAGLMRLIGLIFCWCVLRYQSNVAFSSSF